MSIEKWKDINGFEGLYQVSNLGNIKGLKSGKILNKRFDSNGYIIASLSKEGRQKNYLVHRIVALTFIPNPENKPLVNHRDGNKGNNSCNNLEWSTYSENNRHAYDIGLKKVSNKTIKSLIERKRKEVCQIDICTGETINVWESTREASRQLNISQSSISQCCNGIRNTCGGFKWKYI